MPIVITGDGKIEFPDSMSEAAIRAELEKRGIQPGSLPMGPEVPPGYTPEADIQPILPGDAGIAPTLLRVGGGIAGGLIGSALAPGPGTVAGSVIGSALGDVTGQAVEIARDARPEGYNYVRTLIEGGLSVIPGMGQGATKLGTIARYAGFGAILAPIDLLLSNVAEVGLTKDALPSPGQAALAVAGGGVLGGSLGALSTIGAKYPLTRVQDDLVGGEIPVHTQSIQDDLTDLYTSPKDIPSGTYTERLSADLAELGPVTPNRDPAIALPEMPPPVLPFPSKESLLPVVIPEARPRPQGFIPPGGYLPSNDPLPALPKVATRIEMPDQFGSGDKATLPGDTRFTTWLKASGGVEPGVFEAHVGDGAYRYAEVENPNAPVFFDSLIQRAFDAGYIPRANKDDFFKTLDEDLYGKPVYTAEALKQRIGGIVPLGSENALMTQRFRGRVMNQEPPRTVEEWFGPDQGPMIVDAERVIIAGADKQAHELSTAEFAYRLAEETETVLPGEDLLKVHTAIVSEAASRRLPVSAKAVASAGLQGKVSPDVPLKPDPFTDLQELAAAVKPGKTVPKKVNRYENLEDAILEKQLTAAGLPVTGVRKLLKEQTKQLERLLHDETGSTNIFTDMGQKAKEALAKWSRQQDVEDLDPLIQGALYSRNMVTQAGLNMLARRSEVLTEYGNAESAMLGNALLRVQKNHELDAGAATGLVDKIFRRDLTPEEGHKVWRADYGFLDRSQLTGREQTALAQLQQLRNQVATMAEKLGSQGDFHSWRLDPATKRLVQVPWERRDTYAPIMLQPDLHTPGTDLYKRGIEWLMKEKGMTRPQAETFFALDASMLQRKTNSVANLEKARTDMNWPEWALIQDPYVINQLYFDRAWKRLHVVQTFGQDLTKGTMLLGRIAEQDADLGQFAKRAFQDFIGLNDAEELSKWTKMFGDYTAVTKLSPRTAISQLGQIGLAAVRTNIKSVVQALSNPSVSREAAHNGGALLRSVRQQTYAMLGGSEVLNTSTSHVDRILRLYGIRQLDLVSRVVASGAGQFYADDLVTKLIKSPKDVRHGFWMRRLQQLGVDPRIALEEKLAQIQGGAKDPSTKYMRQMDMASQTVNADVNFRNGILDLPEFFHKHPIASRYKSFMYQSTRFMHDHVIKELHQGNPLPLIYTLSVGGVMGEAIADVQALVSGRELGEHGGMIAKVVQQEGPLHLSDVFKHYAVVGHLGMFEMALKMSQGMNVRDSWFTTIAPPEISDAVWFLRSMQTAVGRWQEGRADYLDPLEMQLYKRFTSAGMIRRHLENLGVVSPIQQTSPKSVESERRQMRKEYQEPSVRRE